MKALVKNTYRGKYCRIGQDMGEEGYIYVGIDPVCVDCIHDDSTTPEGEFILEVWENMMDDMGTCCFCGRSVRGSA